LYVIEASFDEFVQPAFVETNSGGDQIRIELRRASSAYKFGKIGPRQRLATCEVQLQNAHLSGLLEDRQPVSRGEFVGPALHLERVRTVDAMQRTAMSDLSN
jgi:hypothetical protein